MASRLIYTPKEVAAMLKVNERTVRRWVHAGQLPATRFGRQLRISAEALAEFGQSSHLLPESEWLARCRQARATLPASADSGELLEKIRRERADL